MPGNGSAPISLRGGCAGLRPCAAPKHADRHTLEYRQCQLDPSSILVSGDFQLSHNCGTSLAAGASCTILVIFKPAGTGARAGTLTIQDNASGSPQMVSLSGTGVSPANTSVTLYVAPDGDDAFSGTLPAVNAGRTDGPFATFDRARCAVQLLDKTGLRQVIVQFRGGTYYLSDPIRFTAADSGSASMPIIYRNYPDESPVFELYGMQEGAGEVELNRQQRIRALGAAASFYFIALLPLLLPH